MYSSTVLRLCDCPLIIHTLYMCAITMSIISASSADTRNRKARAVSVTYQKFPHFHPVTVRVRDLISASLACFTKYFFAPRASVYRARPHFAPVEGFSKLLPTDHPITVGVDHPERSTGVVRGVIGRSGGGGGCLLLRRQLPASAPFECAAGSE